MGRSAADAETDLATYLWTRLAQLGVRSVHGVPGDYNLTALDRLGPVGLHWVGNANELCAGYAADGYARVRGIGALITSFGVGELSAYNAIAAAYAEHVAVVHIVGTAPTKAQDAGLCLHHSLGDGNFRAFAELAKTVTVAQADLRDIVTAPALIDATLRECVLQNRPVYIEVPTDMVAAKVPFPDSPINLVIPEYNEYLEQEVATALLHALYAAKQPMILVDGLAARWNARAEINELVQRTGIPTLTAPFGKSYVNEHLTNFHGIYAGLAGMPEQKAWVDRCDLIFHFGPLESDVNTFGFTAVPSAQATVQFNKYAVSAGKHILPGGLLPGRRLYMKSLLQKLLIGLDESRIPTPHSTYPRSCHESQIIVPANVSNMVDQYTFWPYISTFLRSGDIVLTETGTAAYGGLSIRLPPNSTLINSFIWLSIGQMLGASQGVALAQRELITSQAEEVTGTHIPRTQLPPADYSKRTILFVGEGSLQMTAQTISDIFRNRLDVLMFVLNNSGYTIERLINGFHAEYNDVQPWRNLEAPSYFGAPEADADYPVRTRRVETWSQLDAVLKDPEIKVANGFNMIEITMAKGDAPESLKKFAMYLEKRNGGKA